MAVRQRVEGLLAADIAGFTLTPGAHVMVVDVHGVDVIVLARGVLDQPGEGLVAEQVGFVQAMPDFQRHLAELADIDSVPVHDRRGHWRTHLMS